MVAAIAEGDSLEALLGEINTLFGAGYQLHGDIIIQEESPSHVNCTEPKREKYIQVMVHPLFTLNNGDADDSEGEAGR